MRQVPSTVEEGCHCSVFACTAQRQSEVGAWHEDERDEIQSDVKNFTSNDLFGRSSRLLDGVLSARVDDGLLLETQYLERCDSAAGGS